MIAWHFVNGTLRDGRPIPKDGVPLKHTGELVMCAEGLHASRRLIDALTYAPGATLCRVELGGKMVHGTDKSVAGERTILWRLDCEALLRDFARRCALDVIHLWDAPDVVVRYLKTGDEDTRAAARALSRAASRAAALDALDASRAAAWAATWYDAAWAAARDAARAAARAATWCGRSSYDAAWDAARFEAAWAAENKRLTSMVMAAHRKESR